MRSMRIDDAEASLRGHLPNVAFDVDSTDVPAAMTAMMDWYARVRAIDAAPIEEDGDMLLFQWGEGEWDGERAFEHDLTRQLIRADEQEDEGIVQVSLTFRYATSEGTADLGSGHRWCGSPAMLAAFRREFEANPAFALARSNRPLGVALSWEVAG